jgi:hypothetical protein
VPVNLPSSGISFDWCVYFFVSVYRHDPFGLSLFDHGFFKGGGTTHV